MPLFSYDRLVKPPAPRVWLRITDTFKGLRFEGFPAIIDSGADRTCLPRDVADQTPGYDYEDDFAEEFTGNTVKVRLVRILEARVEFTDDGGNLLFTHDYLNLRLPIVNAEGLLGRDILNYHTCVLAAPDFVGMIV